ncbi:Cys/Met metabolism PLP-dependent enzyme-domain-containing protein [Gongronella butleri]|nr:Cys/Met metabolism PLP-dependent enzyme-domain-containing protein [Gongronella butleri]
MTNDYGFATKAVHSGYKSTNDQCAIVQPITLSTNFKFADVDKPNDFAYSRVDNPNRQALETAIADLEGGAHAVAFSSGMGAITSVLSLLDADDHVISMNDVYSGTNLMLSKIVPKKKIQVTFVDLRDKDAIVSHFQSNTKMVWIESPTNPTIRLVDIAAVAVHAHAHGALLVVDSTFLTPYFQRALPLGADVVVHSATKFLNGHSDVVLGLAVTNNAHVNEQLRDIQFLAGAVPSPFDCYLARRGMMTLPLRMEQHARNAHALATFLDAHDRVDAVIYPGHASHPQHELAKKQQSGFGGMLAFRLRSEPDLARMLERLQLIELAESLGGVHTLVQIPATMTHVNVNEDQRNALGITSTLVRMSVGIEDIKDLIKDLAQALAD